MKIQLTNNEWVEPSAILCYEENHNGYPVVRLVGNIIRIIAKLPSESNRDAVERISKQVNESRKMYL